LRAQILTNGWIEAGDAKLKIISAAPVAAT
jgi:hypothetical protein